LLSNPTGGAVLGAIAAAAVEIQDNDSRQSAWLTFGLHRIEALQRLVLGIPLWQYIASLIYVFLAFYVSKLLDYVLRTKLRRWAERTRLRWDELLIDLLRGPTKVVTFVVLLHIGLRIFSWPEWMAEFLSKALKIIVALSLTYMALRLVDLLTRFWTQRTIDESDRSFNEQLLPIIRNTIKVFVVIVATLLTLQNLGLNITSLIASVSIGGLALSLAAQDTLSNFFGAIAVLVDKPFRIGENIRVENVEGTVESIGFRSTRVRNFDGFVVSIPNKTVGNATITNMSRRSRIRTVMDIGLTYDTPVEKMQRALTLLNEILRSDEMTHDVLLGFNKFTDSALNIFVIHWWKNDDFKAYLSGIEKMNLAIKQRFDQEKIEFAFPTQTVHVKTDEQPRLQQP
jgi:MscS family membrane protein